MDTSTLDSPGISAAAGSRLGDGVGSSSRISTRAINHQPGDTQMYVGSPSIALLPDGAYVASHDLFGPGSTEYVSGVTLIFRSEDRGNTWTRVARIERAFWSGLFTHRGALYLFGTTHHHGLLVIRRSTDGGRTWTEPLDAGCGRLAASGEFHTAPVPVVEHDGRVWRAVEDAGNGTLWGERYSPLLISAPVGSDLLRRDNWTFTRPLAQSGAWLDATFGGWLEGNAIVSPSGAIVNLLRVACPEGEKAALVSTSHAGEPAFSPSSDFVDFPGGATKFTVRKDARDGRYWTLSNLVPERYRGTGRAAMTRNSLALLCSTDLRHWETRGILLHHPDEKRHGFQYVDWQFEGEDIVAVSRTAADDPWGGAHAAHDANFMTFHRVRGFRGMTPSESAPVGAVNDGLCR